MRRPLLLVVPGMGATAYLAPTMEALRENGPATLLDLPGFGSPRPLACEPSVTAIGAAVAAHARSLPGPVVLLGHSTGSLSVLHAALRLQADGRAPAAVVMAAPVATSRQRSLPRIMAVAPAAYRRDRPGELRVLPQYLRAGPDFVRLLRSALAQRPEQLLHRLRAPLLLMAGRHDAFSPAWWLARLAAAATSSPDVRVVRLPGSHNNPWTQGRHLARVVEGFAARA